MGELLNDLGWFIATVFAIQLVVLGLTYGLLRLIQEYLKDFGHKAGFTKEQP